MTSRKPSEKKSADLSATVREILNLSEETGKKAADGIRKEAAKVKEATTKAAEAAKAKKAEEKKTEETKVTSATEEKAPAKKATSTKKSAAKKTASKAASAAKSTAKKATTAVKKTVESAKAKAEEKACAPKVFIQFAGNSFSLEEILEDARKDYTNGRKKNFKDVQIYIKPEDGKAYYVADGDPGAVDLRYEQ